MTNERNNPPANPPAPSLNDFLDTWRQAAADTEQRWNDFFNELMGTEAFAQTMARSMDGYLAMQAREFLLVDVVVLSILIYALLGKLADTTARLLERLCLSWHPAFQK